MQIIPLLAVPAQTQLVTLGTQNCTIAVTQKSTGLFLDLSIDGAAVLQSQICRDRCWIVRLAYFGFSGDLAFFDTQGTSDPEYTGLGSRWILCYFPASEIS
ncbi:hypothetical protein [Curvibacter lanceolatus]|uniref:phage baseplate plug family protein n=1 Tax=Curvibacter lanceolatus TaxID=86182 RepID=UPI0003803501|nr:hypothetical protein [Curvibacter lanceolatus]